MGCLHGTVREPDLPSLWYGPLRGVWSTWICWDVEQCCGSFHSNHTCRVLLVRKSTLRISVQLLHTRQEDRVNEPETAREKTSEDWVLIAIQDPGTPECRSLLYSRELPFYSGKSNSHPQSIKAMLLSKQKYRVVKVGLGGG